MTVETKVQIQQSGPLANEVQECLSLLYATKAGEQPMDREFGLKLDFLNLPLPAARAQLSAQIVQKTARYESRARVVRVDWEESEQTEGALRPKVVIELVEN